MRVALVVERFEPAGGGIEHAVWQIADGLARAGDEVHVIARRGVESPRATLHRVSVPSFWQPLRVIRFSQRAGAEARREANGFEIVHAFSRTVQQDIFHAGGGSHAHYMKRTYGRMGAALRRVSPRHATLLELERRIFADSQQTVQCVSEMVRREIAQRFGVSDGRMTVIPYGVDLERFQPSDPGQRGSDGEALRQELSAGDATVWLLAGSGWRRKGLDTALRALALSRDRRAHLWVAGSDATAPWQRLASKLGIESRVRFLGARGDIERVYRAADALMLPTRYDAFGLVCLEASACGLPVVTSGAAGAAELIAKAGSIIGDPEDALGLADAMERLSHAALRRQLGEIGVEIAAANDWDAHVQKLRALYRKVAA
jgi:UDP-glucose:(heptosyl)LPS alpha-1,3-glucosyltransferase